MSTKIVSPTSPTDSPSDKLDALTANTNKVASPVATGSTDASCQPWSFKVQVVSIETDWPTDDVQVDLLRPDLGDNVVGDVAVDKLTQLTGREFKYSGQASLTYKPAVSCPRWKLADTQDPKQIQLPAFKGQLLVVKIQRTPWVKFRVEYYNSTTLVPGFKLNLKLPGQQAAAEQNQPDNTLDCELTVSGKSDLLGLRTTSDDEIWEVTSG